MEIPIQIVGIEATELLEEASSSELAEQAGLSLGVQSTEDHFRTGIEDPAVLVALVTGGAAALTALIAGILKIAEKRLEGSGRITIRGSTGRSVEVPVDASDARIQALIEHAKSLDKPTIIVSSKS
ncbi:MAG: hypothetical protein AAGG48_29640 [Planctomycetota bacterium]